MAEKLSHAGNSVGALIDKQTTDTLIVGGIRSSRVTRDELAQMMVDDIGRARDGELIVPNIVIASNGFVIARYHQDDSFRRLIDQADIIDVDGMPLVFATRVFCRDPLRERVATTDFILDACEVAAQKKLNFYFLGAKPDVAQQAADNLEKAFPGLRIVGTRHGYFSSEEEAAICADIRDRKTDVLWLGLGSPKQELFAFRNREKLAGVAWVRTCGGLFDFYSNRIPRAPKWMQHAGLEWLFRAVKEPRRLGLRYLATNPAALYHLATKTRD